MSIKQIMRRDLRSLLSYPSHLPVENMTRLHANELPWSGLEDDCSQLNQYPDKQDNLLINRLSQINQVSTNQCLITRGSDDAIDALTRLVITPFEDAILICPPTFTMYAISGRLQGARIIESPLTRPAFQIDWSDVLSKVDAQTKLLFICRPNNPTGGGLSLDAIVKACQALNGRCIVVVDEAYIEFSSQPSAVPLINDFDNLVVLKTLSKAYGLAGLRLGMVFAQTELIETLAQIIPPFPIPSLVSKTALKALQNLTSFHTRIETIVSQRQWLNQKLRALAMIEQVWPSEANFILFQVADAELVANQLKSHGILIRKITNKLLRVSVGTQAQNEQFIERLEAFQ